MIIVILAFADRVKQFRIWNFVTDRKKKKKQ